MSQNRTEWVMHIWGKKRDTLELNDVEKFHIDMLKLFQDQQKKFDKILINIALDDINDTALFELLKTEVSKVLVNDNVEFKYCQNIPDRGEYVTFRPYVFDRIGEDVNIFYSHFKGYSTYIQINRESFPRRIIDLSEMFWSYIMYRYSLNVDDVKKKLKDKCVYCWFIFKDTDTNNPDTGYFIKYQNNLLSSDERLKEYVADDLHKHSPGSFLWYNMKNIGKALENKPLVKSISTEFLDDCLKNYDKHLFTHFCELYLIQFLNEDDCYSVKDFSNEIKTTSGLMYTTIYSSKLFAREFLPDFDKYIIEKGVI